MKGLIVAGVAGIAGVAGVVGLSAAATGGGDPAARRGARADLDRSGVARRAASPRCAGPSARPTGR